MSFSVSVCIYHSSCFLSVRGLCNFICVNCSLSLLLLLSDVDVILSLWRLYVCSSHCLSNTGVILCWYNPSVLSDSCVILSVWIVICLLFSLSIIRFWCNSFSWNIICPSICLTVRFQCGSVCCVQCMTFSWAQCRWESAGVRCRWDSAGVRCNWVSAGVRCRWESAGVRCKWESAGVRCKWESAGVRCRWESAGVRCRWESAGVGCRWESAGVRCKWVCWGKM